MSIAIDTNILVKLLVDDDPEKGSSALTLIQVAYENAYPVFVPLSVVLESEWVLRSRYGCTKAEVLAMLRALLGTKELRIQTPPVLEEAIRLYTDRVDADFADCMHAATAAQNGCALASLDHAAAALPGAALLTK